MAGVTQSVASEYAYVHGGMPSCPHRYKGGGELSGGLGRGSDKPFRSVVTGWSDSTHGGMLRGNYQPKEEPPPELALLEGVRH